MRLYIAGPVTGKSHYNLPEFEAAARALEFAGLSVVIPHWFVPDGADWNTSMRRCIETLVKCDGVALLDGWQDSTGAKLERSIAKALDMPVASVGEWIAKRVTCLQE